MMLSNMKLRLGLSFLILCFCSVAVFAKAPEGKGSKLSVSGKAGFSLFDIYDAEQEIFRLINRERQKLGIAALEWDERIEGLAQDYSQRMADENFFSHYDRDGKSIKDRVRSINLKRWRKVGENLFKFSGNADFKKYAIRGWMRSESHRQNLLDYQYTSTAVGIGIADNGTIYVTQIFLM